MALTITVTLDDERVQRFLDLYNEDAGSDLTVDSLNQNAELQNAISEDMALFWMETLEDQEHASAYDLYCEFVDDEVEDEVITLPGDPAYDREDLNNEF